MNFNLIDMALIGLIVMFGLIGWYRGFLNSLMHTLSAIGAIIVAAFGYHQIGQFLITKFNALNFILQFTDAGEMIGNIELSRTLITSASEQEIARAMQNCTAVPQFMLRLIEKNIQNRAFADQGLATIEEYFNQTIAISVLHVVSYVALFLVAFLVLELLIGTVSAAVRPPVLRQFDSVAGMVVGFIIGILFVRVLFMLVPTGMSILGIAKIQEWFTSSAIGSIFYNSQFLVRHIKGTLL